MTAAIADMGAKQISSVADGEKDPMNALRGQPPQLVVDERRASCRDESFRDGVCGGSHTRSETAGEDDAFHDHGAGLPRRRATTPRSVADHHRLSGSLRGNRMTE